MKQPRSTGQSARILSTTEPLLAELVRRGKIDPPPVVVAGRRLWYADHLLQAAQHLGVLTPELEVRIRSDDGAAANHGESGTTRGV